jgi:hypothetical protein
MTQKFLKVGGSSFDQRLGIVHSDMTLVSERMDRIESRLGRVETRLNLTHAYPPQCCNTNRSQQAFSLRLDTDIHPRKYFLSIFL